jgi:hypothetical protein
MTDIEHVMKLSILCQIGIQRLFCLKQLMAGVNATSMVLKLHMLLHFFVFLVLMGHCGIWNTDRAEASHIEAKNLGRKSSRRKHYMAKETYPYRHIILSYKMQIYVDINFD